MKTDTLYTIKPLIWKQQNSRILNREVFIASTSTGEYRLSRENLGTHWTNWQLEFHFIDYYDEGHIEIKSLPDGKRKAWADWKKRIIPDLKKIPKKLY